MPEQWSFDKGTGRRAGMGTRGYTAQATLADEAGSATAVGQLLRKGNAAAPHDKVVPVKAFQRDLVRKLRLKKVMAKPKEQREVLAKDKDALLPGQQFTKEQVNYRYSGDPEKSCGACVHFIAPGACEIVAGLINRVDLCDKFEPLHQRRRSGVVPSELIPNEATLGESEQRRHPVVQAYMAEDWDDYLDFGDDDCPDDEKDEYGNCPDDSDFDDEFLGEQAEEVTPPGFEPVVRALKKKPGIQSPWAVAWAMKKKGVTPDSEVTPPGFEPVVRALKKQPGVEEPYAVAWAMKKKGIRPKGDSEGYRIFRGGPGRVVYRSQAEAMGNMDDSAGPDRPATKYDYPSFDAPAGKLA